MPENENRFGILLDFISRLTPGRNPRGFGNCSHLPISSVSAFRVCWNLRVYMRVRLIMRVCLYDVQLTFRERMCKGVFRFQVYIVSNVSNCVSLSLDGVGSNMEVWLYIWKYAGVM